jgi:hypothetical protein
VSWRKLKKLEKQKGAESGSRHLGDGRREEDQLMPNVSKYHGTETNIYSMECRTRGKSGGCSGLDGLRSHKAEGGIERENVWFDMYWETFRTLRMKKIYQIWRRGNGVGVRRARHV